MDILLPIFPFQCDAYFLNLVTGPSSLAATPTAHRKVKMKLRAICLGKGTDLATFDRSNKSYDAKVDRSRDAGYIRDGPIRYASTDETCVGVDIECAVGMASVQDKF